MTVEKVGLAPGTEVKSSASGSSYFVKDLIGQGGMARIYLVDPDNTGALVVMKELLQSSDPAIMPKWIDLFTREGKTHALIPSGVAAPRFYEAFDFNGKKFMTMEQIRGVNLLQLLSTSRYPAGRIDEQRVLQIGIEAAEVIQVLHALGFLHRDVNPKNIMEETGSGKIFVLDFGISHELRGSGIPLPSATPGNVTNMGTISYSSPQQLTCTGLSFSDDVYSLALTLFHLLTGKEPQQNIFDRIDDMKLLPPRLQPIFTRAVDDDPTKRQASMAEFQNDLRQLAGQPVQPLPTPSTTAFRPGAGRFNVTGRTIPQTVPPPAPIPPPTPRPGAAASSAPRATVSPITATRAGSAIPVPTPVPTPIPRPTLPVVPAPTPVAVAKSPREVYGGTVGGVVAVICLIIAAFAIKNEHYRMLTISAYLAWLSFMSGSFAGSGNLDKRVTAAGNTTKVLDWSKIPQMLMPIPTALMLAVVVISFFF